MAVRLVKGDSETLEHLIWEMDQVSRAVKEFEDQRRALQQRITEALVRSQRKSVQVADPLDETKELRVTYVANRRVSVDSAKVKSVLGRSYSKVRSDDVDRAKLDRYLNEVDDHTRTELAKGITITEHPYTRLSRVVRGEVEDDGS